MQVNIASPNLTRLTAKRLAKKVGMIRKNKHKIIKKKSKYNEDKINGI
jgi:hypothetical protein